MDSIRTVVGIFLIVCFGVSGAGAATFYVGPGETCTTIQAGIDAAVSGDVIIVRDGTYTGPGNRDIDFKGKAIHLTSENGAAKCVIDVQGNESARHRGFIFHSGETQAAIVEGFTITGGYMDGLLDEEKRGGGIFCRDSSPTIKGNIIVNNRSVNEGAGIYAQGASSLLIVDNRVTSNNPGGIRILQFSGSPVLMSGNTISENTGVSAGGGVYLECVSATVAGNVITANHGTGYGGGGIFAAGTDLSLIENTIIGNIGGDGAGIHIESGCAGSAIVLSNTIRGNQSDSWGGGVMIHGNITAEVRGNNIELNEASYGAGLYLGDYARLVIAGNNITSNTAGGEGGGIQCRTTGTTLIKNNLVCGNTAHYGGGINCCLGSPTITSNTIAGNSARGSGGGGGIYALLSLPLISNSVLWANKADTPPQLSPPGAQITVWDSAGVTVTHCNVQGGETGTYVRNGSSLYWGEGNTDADPLFANAGTGDYHLKSKYGRWDPKANTGAGGWVIDTVHSPCIDAGDPSSEYSGEPEPNGDRINMGAYGNTGEASKSPCFLTVHSTPITEITITGNKPGATNYMATCTYLEPVSIAAPGSVSSGGKQYTFVRWLIDGVENPEGETSLQLTMAGNSTIVAIYETHLLTVQSAPINGVVITGDKPGTTAYAARCNDQQIVTLTAPAIASPQGVRYNFLRWIPDGEDSPVGQATIQLVMQSDRIAVAMYEVQTHTVTVNSSPYAGIAIGGSRPGTTNYTITCVDQETVDLSAPGQVDSDGRRYNFVRWLINGVEQPAGQAGLHLIVAADCTVVAAYEVQHYSLNVRSAPVNGFSISGDKAGITDYSVICDDGETVNLSAQATATLGGQRYEFLHWTVDGVDGPSGQTSLTIVMDKNRAAAALYRMPRKLTVLSAPVLPVSVTGLKPGATNYVADCEDQQAVYLTAPSSVTLGSKTCRFVCWFIDNEPKLTGQRDILVTMDKDHTALAQYEWGLPYDVNHDCRVDVLDLILVRNGLGSKCSK